MKSTSIITMTAVLLGILISCSQTTMMEEPPPVDDPMEKEDRVQTLVKDFGANDALSVDEDGSIYASNFGKAYDGTQVLKVDPNTGAASVAVDGLKAPTGNTKDQDDNIWVVNNVRRVEPNSTETIGDVLRVSPDGERTTMATLPGFPAGITIDANGNAYISNWSFGGIHRITPDGEVSAFAEAARLTGCVGIAIDENGNIVTGNYISGEILSITPDGAISLIATLPTVVQGTVIGYITYADGLIYATGAGENLIYQVSLDGDVKVLAGNKSAATTDGDLLEASFNRPNGIAVDAKNKLLYVSEGGGNGALRVIKLED